MSLEVLNSFLTNVYDILDRTAEIKNFVSGVYLSINPNPIYPFIFININKAINQSNCFKYAYSIDFDISLFYRDRHPDKALKLAESINKLVASSNFTFSEYKILGLQKQNVLLSKSEDTLTTKLAINYLSFIRQK
jgi:hypothetical protein